MTRYYKETSNILWQKMLAILKFLVNFYSFHHKITSGYLDELHMRKSFTLKEYFYKAKSFWAVLQTHQNFQFYCKALHYFYMQDL